MSTAVSLAYLAASILFILGIKLLGSPKTARRGNLEVRSRARVIRARLRLADRAHRHHAVDAGRVRRGVLDGVAGFVAIPHRHGRERALAYGVSERITHDR